MAPKGRHMRSNPQSPMAAPEPDPEKILKKGKVLQVTSSSKFSGSYGDLPDSAFDTPIFVSHIIIFILLKLL